MIKTLVTAGLTCAREYFINAAQSALAFLFNHLWKNQRLLASYKDGRANLPGYLDDYAFLIDALWCFLQARWRDDFFQWMVALTEQMIELFFDQEQGGFFTRLAIVRN